MIECGTPFGQYTTMTKLKRRQFIHGLAAGAAGGMMGWLQRALAADAKSLPQGIVEVKGEVMVNGKPAAKGVIVAAGNVVETGKAARVVFVIGNNAFLQRQNSRVEFGVSIESFLRVVTGGSLSVFGTGERKLSTMTVAIGIRGTGCYIETDEKKNLLLPVLRRRGPEAGRRAGFQLRDHAPRKAGLDRGREDDAGGSS